MKLKYYLRGLGLGIIATALILIIARNINGGMSDKEIIKRAEALGMVMSTEDSLFDKPDETTASTETTAEESTTGESLTEESSENQTEEKTSEEESTENSITEEPSSQSSETQTSPSEEETTSVSETESTTEEITEETTTVKTAVITITKGMRCMEVSNMLYKEGIIDDTESFNQYMRNHGYTQEILIGTYTLNSGMSYDEIAGIIVRKIN